MSAWLEKWDKPLAVALLVAVLSPFAVMAWHGISVTLCEAGHRCGASYECSVECARQTTPSRALQALGDWAYPKETAK